MIKLKDIINDILNEEVEPLRLSKMEEAEAVSYIKLRVIPEVVEIFNDTYPHNYLIGKRGEWIKRDTGSRIKPSDILRVLKKSRLHWGYEYDKKIEVITYSADVQLTNREKGHQKHHVFDFYIFKDRQLNKVKIEVNLHLSAHRNKKYVMGGQVTESQEPKSPSEYVISKQEEAESFEALKKIMIPSAVEVWNRHSPQHWRITDETLRKVIKKSKFSKGPGGDIITYQATFRTPGNRKPHTIKFELYKIETTPRGTGVYGDLDPNLQGVGKNTWRLI